MRNLRWKFAIRPTTDEHSFSLIERVKHVLAGRITLTRRVNDGTSARFFLSVRISDNKWFNRGFQGSRNALAPAMPLASSTFRPYTPPFSSVGSFGRLRSG